MKHVLLVGATDGIGLALARHYLENRDRVAIVGRDPEKLSRVAQELQPQGLADHLSTVVCDVTDGTRAGGAFEEAVVLLGGLDIFVYCAGVMLADDSPAAAQEVRAVNVDGAKQWCELAAAHLVADNRGQIAAIGSVAGDRVLRGHRAYGGSKAALHGYLEELRARLAGTGVNVSTVKPGWVKTRMAEGKFTPGAIEPETAARQIAAGLASGRDVFYVPGWWRLVSRALRLLPGFMFDESDPA